MNNIPTAEELMNSRNGEDYTYYEEIANLMREFAKLHIEAAYKAIAENASISLPNPWMGEKYSYIDKESIIKAYPLTNIK